MNQLLGGVFWHQGMFMQPQHFQLEGLSWQKKIQPIFDSGLPYFWGIGELEFEPLVSGSSSLVVRNSTILFQDGSFTEFSGNANIESRQYDHDSFDSRNTLMVYAGLKRLNWIQPNVSLAEEGETVSFSNTRYVSSNLMSEVPDLYANGPPASVKVLHYSIKLIFENELANFGGYLCIPVAKLVRVEGGVKFSEDYIPPCYRTCASPTLSYMLKQFCNDLMVYIVQLQEYKFSGELHRSNVDSYDMKTLFILRGLSQFVSYLKYMIDVPTLHPWHLYGGLVQLAGELSVYSSDNTISSVAAPFPPPYEHLNIHGCFSEIMSFIISLLDGVYIKRWASVKLTISDFGLVANLTPDMLEENTLFYLVIRTNESNHEAIKSIKMRARLASPNDLSALVIHAMTGLELLPLKTAPKGLPKRDASLYFQIKQSGKLWNNVISSKKVALMWPEAPSDLDAEVVAIGS